MKSTFLLPLSCGATATVVAAFLCPPVLAAEPAGSRPASAPTAPAKSGLLNEWLRSESAAWDRWDVGGQVRLRYESFENGGPTTPSLDFQNRGADADNDFLWLREKLHVGYRHSWAGLFVEGRNSDAWGDEDPRDPGQDRFDLHQAYLTLGNQVELPLTAKIGRQELAYGDERLIGASDWSNTGRVFDGANLRFAGGLGWVHAFAARVVQPVDGRFNEPDSDDWLFGLYSSSKTLVPIQESQLYVLSRNVDAGGGSSPRDIVSLGARVKSLPGKLAGWDYAAELVGQIGTITQGGERRDQRAFAAAGGGAYTWADTPGTPRLGLEYNFSSGDSDPTDDTSQTLDNLFPTNHRHYGLMDFIGWRNIHNPRVSFSVKPHRRLTASLDFHLFWLADTHDYFYPQGGSGRQAAGYGRHPSYPAFVGSELDLDVNYAVTDWAGLRAGFGHFFPGDYVERSKQAVGGDTGANWAYLQATLSF